MYSHFLPRLSYLLVSLGVLLLLTVVAPTAAQAQVDLNSASLGELAAVDGISDAMARQIVNARPLRTKRDLVTRLGMQENVYSRVSNSVVARQGTGSGSGSGSGTGSGTGGTDFGRTSGTGGTGTTGRTGSGSGTGDFGRTGGTTGGDYQSGTGGSGRTGSGTGNSGGYNTGTGSGTSSGTGSGTGVNTGSGTSSSGTGDGNVYRENYRSGRSSLRTGDYQDSISRLLEARAMAEQYGNRQEVYEIDADLASAYLWRGIELYKDATWANDYDTAISYLEKANIRITTDDLWMRALGGTSTAVRKHNLKNYYLGMCYFEKGAYFDWVDNDGLAKMYLSQVVSSREQWGYFSDPKLLAEQKILYADAKYTLGMLFEKTRDSRLAAESYMEAYKTYQQLQATGLGELFYYWGEGQSGTSYNQLMFSTRRKKREGMSEKMVSMENSLVNLGNRAIASNNYGDARQYSDFVFRNSRVAESRSRALDVTIASYEKANDWNRAIETRRQFRNEYGYHKHTVGMAQGYRQLGDTGQAKRLYQEVATASGADRQYVVAASDGLADLTLPEIDAKISAGNMSAAIASIKSFLDSYPTSKKSDFVRRVGDIVDQYAAAGQADQALKLIEDFTSRYTKGADSALLDAKKVTILEKSGDFKAYQAAVLDFDAKYSGIASDTANNLLVRLIQASEKQGGNQANVQALVDKLAARGNSFGMQRHQQAAQAELARIKGLGNKAEIRVGLARMATFPSSSYATAKSVVAEARELYLQQYASPWYYDSKRQLAASPESAKGVFGGWKDDKGHMKHEAWQTVFSAVEQREVSTYATWDGAALDQLFGAGSSASVAYKSLTDRIAKELAAYNAWQDAGMFKKGGFKKTYEALVASSPNRAALQNDFIAKAYARGTGGSNSGTSRRETAPSFDGVR